MHRACYLALLGIAIALIGCGGPHKQIAGKWKAGDAVWDFASNGTLTTDGQPGRYTFGDQDRIKIQTGAATFVYQLELQSDRMTWIAPNGSKTELTRIK